VPGKLREVKAQADEPCLPPEPYFLFISILFGIRIFVCIIKNWKETETMNRPAMHLAAVLLGALGTTGILSTTATADPAMDLAKKTYLRSCANCHGPKGRGDGPLAKLLTKGAPDLTQIAKRNKGVFPFLEVMTIIDGRKEIGAHGSLEMPTWGEIFRDQDVEKALGRIVNLTLYVHSIQESK
jgi:mono/diheme cytochrome c family protein